MLEKIVSISNVGRFRNYGAVGYMLLRKLTLVYAENGRGKTTLCAILRSLQTGRPEYVMERKTLSASGTAAVHLRLDGASCQFSNGAWTTSHPDIAVFDSVFIHENVYSGDYVEHEHRKNQYRVIVGAQGVQLAREIEDLNAKIQNANPDLRTKKDAVSRNLPSDTSLDEYLAWQPIPDIEAQILQKIDELGKLQRAAAKSDEITTKEKLVKIQLPHVPHNFFDTLSKGVTDVVANAETKVREQISRHQMGQRGEPWLSQGLGYVVDDLCPFCGQVVGANDLIAAYRSHFNTSYRALKEEVAELNKGISNAIGEGVLSGILQSISSNTALSEFWKQFITVELPKIPFADVQEKYSDLRTQCLTLVEKKQNNPTQPVTTSPMLTSALKAVEAFGVAIDRYNLAVETANDLIDDQKTAVESHDKLESVKSEIARLEARKKRFGVKVAELCNAYQEAVVAKTKLEKRKEIVRQRLDQNCRDLLEAHEDAINEYLDQFNAGFRIANTKPFYKGGTPSSHFQIEINSTVVDLGDARTPAGTPCFKTTLSSGDRSALALAFFLATLKQDPDIGAKIVVFDDPFTSLDRFRRTCTQQLIQRLADSGEQVIVLSHDPHFLKLLWDECPNQNANAKAVQMSKGGDTTIITEWDIQAETQASYMKDFSTLLSFYRERKGEPRAVARTIRPFLEGMLRSHFPRHFQQDEWLGEFIAKIREADGASGLQHAKADLIELEAINGYSKKYHHQQNVNADAEPINDDELHAFVKRTLRLVGGC